MVEQASTLRPWSFEKHEQPSVTALLERVSREKGSFKDITTASLQEELATEGALDLSDSDEDSPVEQNQQQNGAITREDLFRAKHEMLEKVSYAHNEVMMALDFVSLLGSKDTAAGRQTMSQFLKENVPAGTLGSDLWKRPPANPSQEAQNLALAQNVRVEVLEKSADEILTAAKVLESSVKAEVHYWNQINTITAKGWSLCRLPGPQQKLGVRFGFSESAPRFQQAGTAALETNEDGDITLPASIDKQTKLLRVSVWRKGALTGQSSMSALTGLDIRSLESRIRQARDSLFDEELFYEMERESRNMVSHGVQAYDSTLSLPLDDATDSSIRFELQNSVSVGLSSTLPSSEDMLANTLLCATRLLLCHAHRDMYTRRSQIPPPLSDRPKERSLTHILRPIMAYISTTELISHLNTKLDSLKTVLESAGLHSTFSPLHFSIDGLDQQPSTQQLLSSLLSPIWSKGSINLSTKTGESMLKLELTIYKDILYDAPTKFTISLADRPDINVLSYSQACAAVDREAAVIVAKLLTSRAGEGWHADDIKAELFYESTGDDTTVKHNEAAISIETEQGQPVLNLFWPGSNHQWLSSRENAKSLLDVWNDVAGSQ